MKLNLIFILIVIFSVISANGSEKYSVLAEGKSFETNSEERKFENSDNRKILVVDDFQTKEFDKIRIFIKISADQKNNVADPLEERLVRVSFYHNNPTGSDHIKDEDIVFKGDQATGFFSVDVYGDSMRIVVWDISLLSERKYSLTATAYRSN